jgi:hypothetical protein
VSLHSHAHTHPLKLRQQQGYNKHPDAASHLSCDKLQRLGLQDAVEQMSVIHVAGTKGKACLVLSAQRPVCPAGMYCVCTCAHVGCVRLVLKH